MGRDLTIVASTHHASPAKAGAQLRRPPWESAILLNIFRRYWAPAFAGEAS